MSGYDGGQLASMVDISVHVPSFCIEHVEDIHLILEHMITKALKEKVTTVLVQETGDLSC